MIVERIYLPVTEESKLLNPNDFERTPLLLSGLNYLDITLVLFESKEHNSMLNTEATKIVRYLMNPSVIVGDISIYNDILMEVIYDDSKYDKKTISKKVFELIQHVFDSKNKKEIPKELKIWLEERLNEFKKKKEKADKTKWKSDKEQEAVTVCEYALENYGKTDLIAKKE